MKVDNKYLQRLGVLPYEDATRTRTRPRRMELRGQWTMELEEDLRHVHGLNIENEILDTLVAEAQERGEYGDLEELVDPNSTGALAAFRSWLRSVRNG